MADVANNERVERAIGDLAHVLLEEAARILLPDVVRRLQLALVRGYSPRSSAKDPEAEASAEDVTLTPRPSRAELEHLFDDAEMLTNEEAAALLGINASALEQRRSQKGGPKYQKIHGRIIYRKQDVVAYKNSRPATRPGPRKEEAACSGTPS